MVLIDIRELLWVCNIVPVLWESTFLVSACLEAKVGFVAVPIVSFCFFVYIFSLLFVGSHDVSTSTCSVCVRELSLGKVTLIYGSPRSSPGTAARPLPLFSCSILLLSAPDEIIFPKTWKKKKNVFKNFFLFFFQYEVHLLLEILGHSFSPAQTTDAMNLGQGLCLSLLSPTLDSWLEITQSRKFVIQGSIWSEKILISSFNFTASQMAQQGKQMRVGAFEGFGYQSVKLVLPANGNMYEADSYTCFLTGKALYLC